HVCAPLHEMPGSLDSVGVPEESDNRHLFFFFNDTATPEIYTLSLHDALPISARSASDSSTGSNQDWRRNSRTSPRSEEHTSELQSHSDLVCRLLLEKKKK